MIWTGAVLLSFIPIAVCNAQTEATSAGEPEEATQTAGTAIERYASAIALFVDEQSGTALLDINDIYLVRYGGPDGTEPGSEFLDGGGRAALEFPIPPEAWEIGGVEELGGLEAGQYGRTANGVGISKEPAPGGTVTYHFRYFLRPDDIAYRLKMPYRTERVMVLVQAAIAANVHPHGLRSDGEKEVPDAGLYSLYSGGEQPAGSEIVIAIHAIEVPGKEGGLGLAVLISHLVALAIIIAFGWWGFRALMRKRRKILESAQGGLSASPLDALDKPATRQRAAAEPKEKRPHSKRRGKKNAASEIDRLAEAIARLDLQYEDGELQEGSYREKRGLLKQELADAVRGRDAKG